MRCCGTKGLGSFWVRRPKAQQYDAAPEGGLEQLHLPLAGANLLPQYDLIAERMPDGSLEVGLARIVTPVVVDLS